MLIIDFETRSRCNLLTAGGYQYAQDPSTDIICMAAVNVQTGAQYLWYAGELFPKGLDAEFANADLIAAHNAEFDRLIWECVAVDDYNFPTLRADQWYCTAAQCRVNGLPTALADAAWALGLKNQKFAGGKDLIKKLSIPQDDGTFNLDPQLIKEMGAYCLQDVLTTKDIFENTRMMMQDEHKDWLVNFAINDRGVKIDRPMAESALQYAGAEQAEIGELLAEATGGAVTKHTQSARMRDWVLKQCPEASDQGPTVRAFMTRYKDGKQKWSLDKSVRDNILTAAEDHTLYLPDDVFDAIALMDDGNKSSVAKFKRMTLLASPEDDRVRGAFMFAGAAATLRYTSRGLQLHNMRRDCWDVDMAEHLAMTMAQDGGLTDLAGEELPVMNTLSKLLRPALIPDEGNVFVVGDWSAIEGRVLPWLSDSLEGDAKLERFKSGEDIYVSTAKDMGIDSRQIGKVAELALGYQGGVGAFQSMARNYGIKVPDSEAQSIVDRWRAANPWAVRFWAELDTASKQAMAHPGSWCAAGMVSYYFASDLMGGTLLCKLPGEHMIQYPQARMEEVETPWGEQKLAITALKASFKPKAAAKGWPRGTLYAGLLGENSTQAFAACLLRNSLRQLDAVVADVHDEIILEVPYDESDSAAENLQAIMESPPTWARGLPLTAEPSVMRRYGKG